MSSADRTAHHPVAQKQLGRKKPSDSTCALLLGVVAAVVGLGPWLITGARLPLQNLWGLDTLPEDMPIALLPLSQYSLTTIVILLIVGGAATGIALRVWNPTRYKAMTRWAVGGVFLVHLIAVLQSFTVLHRGLADGTAADVYFLGILAGVLASIAASIVLLVLLAARSKTLVTLGIGLLSVPFVSWLTQWVVGAMELMGGTDFPVWLAFVSRWLPAVLVGCALAWCGLRSIRQALVWGVNLALLWLVPALFTSVTYVFGTRVYLGNPHEMLILAQQILTATLGPDGGAAPTVLLAILIAALGTGIRTLAAANGRRITDRPTPS
ncbi:hypothetical protein [Arthrobacter pityocampae]|uniref:hypothetical protein n=1 Tax=Arthrobacter pityocampae TaxID=547334 RepID=UPI0037356BDF